MAKPPFPWIGSKEKIAPYILQLFPPKLTQYVEPFGGSGAVLLALPPDPNRLDIYNDLDAELVNLFSCIKEGLARELAPYNVHVNAIAPGSIDTPMTTAGRDPAEYQATIQKMPLHRRGQPEELAGPVALLLSEAGAFMIGTTLDVNGGSYMY